MLNELNKTLFQLQRINVYNIVNNIFLYYCYKFHNNFAVKSKNKCFVNYHVQIYQKNIVCI